MANGQVDPAKLEGKALMRWYRRTPEEIEAERRQAATDAYNRFFYPTQSDQAAGSDDGTADGQDPPANGAQAPIGDDDGQAAASPSYDTAPPVGPASSPFAAAFGTSLLGDWRRYAAAPSGDQGSPAQGAIGQGNGQANAGQDNGGAYPTAWPFDGPIRSTIGSGLNNRSMAPSDDTLWIATGSGGYRPVRSGNSTPQATLTTPLAPPAGLPANPAAPEDADFIDVGNPHNPRLRREWEKTHGQQWPKTDDGRNFDVAHKRAIADGGTNTLDNIVPMHPDEHAAQHLNNGDSARWGKRSSIARAFGGTVEPPNPGRTVRGFGLLSILPWITGFASGNIRHDTQEHMWYDMIGYPAPDDYDTARCRAIGVNNIKPGETCV
jgi:hypothetical protein